MSTERLSYLRDVLATIQDDNVPLFQNNLGLEKILNDWWRSNLSNHLPLIKPKDGISFIRDRWFDSSLQLYIHKDATLTNIQTIFGSDFNISSIEPRGYQTFGAALAHPNLRNPSLDIGPALAIKAGYLENKFALPNFTVYLNKNITAVGNFEEATKNLLTNINSTLDVNNTRMEERIGVFLEQYICIFALEAITTPYLVTLSQYTIDNHEACTMQKIIFLKFSIYNYNDETLKFLSQNSKDPISRGEIIALQEFKTQKEFIEFIKKYVPQQPSIRCSVS